ISLACILHSGVVSGASELLVFRKSKNRAESHILDHSTRSPVAEREAVSSAVHLDCFTRSQRKRSSPSC
ncbi:unnamed protein product, partial [Arabidopsis halleri]